jgi:ribosomal protein S12 methylthiotransferase accessory factor
MQQLTDTLARLVAPNFGLLTYVSEVQLQVPEPDIFIAVAEYQEPRFVSAHTRHLNLPASDNRQASGAGLDRESALWSTIGEAVERYAGSMVAGDNLFYASANELDGDVLSPEQMILFADWQYQQPNFPFVRFDANKPFGWVKGYNLTKKCDANIPAKFVYVDYVMKHRHEMIDNGYSTGLAAGPNMAAAISSGIREVVERDAFACHFLTGIAPAAIDLAANLPQLPPALQKALSLEHINYTLGDMTTDIGIPAAISMLRCGDKLGISTGTSCHFKPGLALEKAVVESFHTFNWILDINRWQAPIHQPSDIRSFADHVTYYLNKERQKDLAFLFEPARRSNFTAQASDFTGPAFAGKEEMNQLVKQLADKGFDIYVVDLTTDDIAQLGFNVVKVIIPGLQPLWAGHGNQHLDPRRLTQFTQNMGYPTPAQYNLVPHAFP